MAFLTLVQFGTWAQDKNEALYGTWASEVASPQEVVLAPGSFEVYTNLADTVSASGTERIDGTWTDSEGHVWYKTFQTVTAGSMEGAKYQSLQEISNSGAKREVVSVKVGEFDPGAYPTKIDPKDDSYLMYNRAGKYLPQRDEVAYATWTNGSMAYQKIVVAPGGYKLYTHLQDTSPTEEGKELMGEKWSDADGNVWYKTFAVVIFGPFKGAKLVNLLKISKSGTVREVTFRSVGFISLSLSAPKMDPTNRTNYFLWYRKD